MKFYLNPIKNITIPQKEISLLLNIIVLEYSSLSLFLSMLVGSVQNIYINIMKRVENNKFRLIKLFFFF